METIPVYFINGFLESGKTTFLKETIDEDYFYIDGRTLLIVCEEGIEEYSEALLARNHTVMEEIEDEEDFTVERLRQLESKHRPERVIIEYNGMWGWRDKSLPAHWEIQQQISFIDASTFANYFANMRSLIGEQVRQAELIVFNRCQGNKDLPTYRRGVKAINPRAEIVFEDADEEVANQIAEEELPYDVRQDDIAIADDDFGIFYMDALENAQRYEGKTVEFKGMVLKPGGLPKNYFVPGRMAMTCCAQDLAFIGFVCKTKEARKLPNRQWVKVRAEVKNEYWADYGGKGPVLYALDVQKTDSPKEEVLNLT